ncbi:MAG TPA: hypothetical protein VHI13_04300 [Candidatus Kapabacteria bacterium]|nr:hypothetical protein [Candidatus Kapabacteria bacterium]
MVMRKLSALITLSTLCATVFLWTGCRDNPAGSSGDDGTVTMQAEMTGNTVYSATTKGSVPLSGGSIVDSIHVRRIRILISDLKLHRDREDTVTGDRVVKTGPIVIQVDSSGAKTFAIAPIPPGTYDRVKFEFHRLTPPEIALVQNDTLFADFTSSDHSSMVMDVVLYINGMAVPYTYRTDIAGNIQYWLDPPVQIGAGSNTTISLMIDPVLIFRGRGHVSVLDPRDHGNKSDCDDGIKIAIRVRKCSC